MRSFAIVDGSRRGARACAVLRYDEKKRAYSIELAPWATGDDLPMTLAPFADAGERTVDPAWSRAWVEERVVPPSRQNLGQVLKANGLSEYDNFALLMVSRGRSSQDDFELVELAPGEDPFAGDRATAHVGDSVARQVGAAIAVRRKQLGITQRELADAIGVRQSVVSRVETGGTNPTLGLLEDLARGLGASLKVTLE